MKQMKREEKVTEYKKRKEWTTSTRDTWILCIQHFYAALTKMHNKKQLDISLKNTIIDLQ